MKIKQKKQLNLPQLIEWLLESGKSECIVISNMNNIVRLEPYGAIRFSQEKFYPEETFTVEVEEVVDKDTVIPKMLVVGRFDGYEEVYNQKLINFTQHLLSAYIIHDDGHMELIYDEEKGMVE